MVGDMTPHEWRRLYLAAQRRRKRSIALATLVVWLTWLGMFGLLEGAALTKRVGWTTLSEFAWDAEVYPPLRWTLLLGLAVLQAHIVGRWPR